MKYTLSKVITIDAVQYGGLSPDKVERVRSFLELTRLCQDEERKRKYGLGMMEMFFNESPKWLCDAIEEGDIYARNNEVCVVAPCGELIVPDDGWICRTIEGNLFVEPDSDFKKTYEKVED